MKVYVVTHGQVCETNEVIGVFTHRKDAVKFALSQKCCFPGGWEPDSEVEDYWENGNCDFVDVTKWKVE